VTEDLRIAYEMEAMLVKQHGLLIPSRCDCRFKVLASYPGHPWYFVHLACLHALPKLKPNLHDPQQHLSIERRCAWVTGTGEFVPTYILQKAYDRLCPLDSVDLAASDGASITRSGGTYYLENGALRYDEPEERF